MPLARYQKRIDNGRAIMYLTRLVKFKSKKMFPAKPQAREQAFRMISLTHRVRTLSQKAKVCKSVTIEDLQYQRHYRQRRRAIRHCLVE
jgi:hypothetical protein